ncbi:putative major capsid protein L1 [Rosellinia necatrix]|uniref:Putative major capsid protein L1 n=1 Tax=Rosellinia necatrix TaxID=77044 RepID=A0A1S7ULI3_ROSNE|nr:putative major capsid protein L1 [Rosellinia necatrix]
MVTTEWEPTPKALEPMREPQQSPAAATTAAAGGAAAARAGPSQPVEFRGFEFFAQRDYNEYRDASRAYFAEKNANPSSWLGDATPPASAHASLDEPRPASGEAPYSSNEGQPKSEKRILGLQRPWFWTCLAITIVLVIVAIGVGIGVGVGAKRATDDSKSASAAGLASDTASTAMSLTQTLATDAMQTGTSSPIPTSTRAPASSTQPSSPSRSTKCPGVNGTVYEVPGSTKRFLQLCGVDYGKEDGAVDLRSVFTNTAEDCIDNCAGTKGCTGCGWGFIDGDEALPYRCWLKTNVDEKPHSADATWHFAVLL